MDVPVEGRRPPRRVVDAVCPAIPPHHEDYLSSWKRLEAEFSGASLKKALSVYRSLLADVNAHEASFRGDGSADVVSKNPAALKEASHITSWDDQRTSRMTSAHIRSGWDSLAPVRISVHVDVVMVGSLPEAEATWDSRAPCGAQQLGQGPIWTKWTPHPQQQRRRLRVSISLRGRRHGDVSSHRAIHTAAHYPSPTTQLERQQHEQRQQQQHQQFYGGQGAVPARMAHAWASVRYCSSSNKCQGA